MVILPIVLFLAVHTFASVSESCFESYKNLVSSNPTRLTKLIYYSGKDINDFGDQYSCEKLKNTKFFTLIAELELFTMGLGICCPNNCKANEILKKSYNLTELIMEKYPASKKFLENSKLSVVDVKEYEAEKFDWPAIFTIVFLGILGFLVVFGTFYSKVFENESIFRCFSLTDNWKKLVVAPDNSSNALSVFNGIRVLSMLLICLGHNYSYSFTGPTVNPARAFDIFKDFWPHLAFISFYMVDMFFVISGFLVAYLLIAELQKHQGKQNWFLFIFHRLIRICPIYFIVFIFYLNLMRYMGSGALWPLFWTKYENLCDHWWTNLLFISNIYPPDKLSCMGWSWFISNEMQFHMMSPIVLILHHKNKRWGYTLLIALTLFNFLCTLIESIVNNYSPGVLYGVSNNDQFIHNYQRPYNRMGPYLLGMIFGFVYRGYVDHLKQTEPGEFELKSTGEGLIHHKHRCKITAIEVLLTDWVQNTLYRRLAFFTGFITMLSIPFVPYKFDKYGPDYWSTTSKSLFLASEHIGFSLAFILWLLPLTEGFGGIIFRFLSNKWFSVLAKFSFTFYLVHPIVILLYVFNRPNSVFISHFNYFYDWPSTVVYSIICAVGLTICIESPVLALEKYLFGTSRVAGHH